MCILFAYLLLVFRFIFLFSHPPFCQVLVQTCFSIFERADFLPAVSFVAQQFQMRGVAPFQDRVIEFWMVVESWDVPLKLRFSFSMRRGVSALKLAVRGL